MKISKRLTLIVLLGLVVLGAFITFFNYIKYLKELKVADLANVTVSNTISSEYWTPKLHELKETIKIEKDDFSYIRLAEYEVTGINLGLFDKFDDEYSSALPFDLVLAWGYFKESSNLSRIKIFKNNRFIDWKLNIKDKNLSRNIGNIHILKLDDPTMRKKLIELKKGSVVTLKGFLVNIKLKNKTKAMLTSLSENDEGPGACEIFELTEIIIH